MDFSVGGSGYYEAAETSSANAGCRFAWKDVASGAWVIGSGPVDRDVQNPPLPHMRSDDTPRCFEDVQQFASLMTTENSGMYSQSMGPSEMTITFVPAAHDG